MLNEVVIWSLISMLFWFVVAAYIGNKTKDGFHVGVIFSLLFLLTYPLKLIATKYGFAVMDSNSLGDYIQLQALLVSNISAMFFIVPIFLLCMRKNKSHRFIIEPSPANEGALANRKIWLCLFWICVVMTYGVDPFLNILKPENLNDINHARGDLRIGSSGNALFSAVGKIALTIYSISLYLDLKQFNVFKKVTLFFSWLVGSYVLLAASGSKHLALLPFFIFILVMVIGKVKACKGISFKKTVIIGAVFVVLIAIAGFLRGFGQLQGGGSIAFQSFIQLINAFDAPDNLSFILSRIDDFFWGDLNLQPTIQYVFTSWVPRFIWNDKPLIYGNMYIMEIYFPERFNGFENEVISPSMAGEMLVSGGVFFMCMLSFILGAIHAVFYHMAIFSGKLIWLILYIWLAQNVFSVLRSGTGFVGIFIVYIVLSILVVYISKELKKCLMKMPATSPLV